MKGTTILIVIVTAFAVYNILNLFGLFEYYTRPRKTIEEIQLKRKVGKKRKRELKMLNLYASSVNLFRGIFMSESLYSDYKYIIQRLDLRTKYLGRLLTPEELRGKKVLPFLLSLLFIPLCFIKPLCIIIPALCLLNLTTYTSMCKIKIEDEDIIIDNNFLNLYLLLYSKLRQGSRARLQSTLENYIDTLKCSKQTKESKVMLKFARYFLNLLALYEDHVAVSYILESYKSATIINFCNIASQALNGVENADNLLTFKIQLTDRRTIAMRKRQKILVKKAERSIYCIWIILGIFVLVSMYSKMPIDQFSSMF